MTAAILITASLAITFVAQQWRHVDDVLMGAARHQAQNERQARQDTRSAEQDARGARQDRRGEAQNGYPRGGDGSQ